MAMACATNDHKAAALHPSCFPVSHDFAFDLQSLALLGEALLGLARSGALQGA